MPKLCNECMEKFKEYAGGPLYIPMGRRSILSTKRALVMFKKGMSRKAIMRETGLDRKELGKVMKKAVKEWI